ncbi:MAG: hypothetical protein ACLURW_00230 [Flavonifractor plautii]
MQVYSQNDGPVTILLTPTRCRAELAPAPASERFWLRQNLDAGRIRPGR